MLGLCILQRMPLSGHNLLSNPMCSYRGHHYKLIAFIIPFLYLLDIFSMFLSHSLYCSILLSLSRSRSLSLTHTQTVFIHFSPFPLLFYLSVSLPCALSLSFSLSQYVPINFSYFLPLLSLSLSIYFPHFFLS